MLSAGAIAGIVIGSIAGACLLVLLVLVLIFYPGRWSKKSKAVFHIPASYGDDFQSTPISHGDDAEFNNAFELSPHDVVVIQEPTGYLEAGQGEPVNWGSMHVKGVRDTRGDRPRELGV
jgi:hypothetical protein